MHVAGGLSPPHVQYMWLVDTQPSTFPRSPSQAATLGGPRAASRRNPPGEEDATGKSRKIQWGSYPAGFVLAEAPAHASTGELLQLAADRARDGWRREQLRIGSYSRSRYELENKLVVILGRGTS